MTVPPGTALNGTTPSGSVYLLGDPRLDNPTWDRMFKTGLIKTRPATWKEFFFPVVHNLAGT